MNSDTPIRPDGKPHWYGRRKTHKLRPRRQQLVNDLLPRLRIADPETSDPIDLSTAFDAADADIRLEIGFGAGEHLLGDAVQNPGVNFIGCEPFINGVSALLADLDDHRVKNVRLFDDDARLLLGRLPDASISRIYLLFPDPWPKARHHRRRFVQRETLDTFARLAKDGAEFIFASDHKGYVAWTLAQVLPHPDWTWTARRPQDWRDPPEGWVETRYEAKGKRKGDLPAYLTFRRNNRT